MKVEVARPWPPVFSTAKDKRTSHAHGAWLYIPKAAVINEAPRSKLLGIKFDSAFLFPLTLTLSRQGRGKMRENHLASYRE